MGFENSPDPHAWDLAYILDLGAAMIQQHSYWAKASNWAKNPPFMKKSQMLCIYQEWEYKAMTDWLNQSFNWL